VSPQRAHTQVRPYVALSGFDRNSVLYQYQIQVVGNPLFYSLLPWPNKSASAASIVGKLKLKPASSRRGERPSAR